MLVSIKTIELVILFLLGIELFQMEMPILTVLFFIILMTSIKKHIGLRISAELIVLSVCFTINYFVLLFRNEASLSIFYIIRSWLGPIMAYLIGYFMVDKKNSVLIKVISVLGIGFFIHGFLNLISSSNLTVSSRSATNFWTGRPVTATLQSTYFIIAIGVSVYWLFFYKKKYKFFGIVIIFCVLWNAMLTASRTPLFLTGLMLIIGYALKQLNIGDKKSMFIKMVKLFLGLGVITIILILLYHYNVFNIKAIFEKSYLGIRLAGIENETAMSRSESWSIALWGILKNPFGFKVNHYAHNLWLDFGMTSGVFPFLLLILYFVMIVDTLIKKIRNRVLGIRESTLIVLVYFCMCVSFMLEPILQGVPFLFFAFCIINGGVASLNNKKVECYKK